MNDYSVNEDDALFRETHYARYGYERTYVSYYYCIFVHLYIDKPSQTGIFMA
jgi:hypothetical protein